MSEQELRATISRLMRGLNHDMKNPLGAADGYLDLLLQGFRGDLTPEQRQTLERIRTLIGSGINILEDVVSYVRASTGELNVHRADTDLAAIVRMALEPHRERAQGAGIALEFESADGALRAQCDPDLVGQIVDRLVANALDHTPDGGRVDVRMAREDGRIVTRISDTGPGVPEPDRERVFLAFERGAQPARQRVSAGIGFGLALGRALAERMEGSLDLEPGSDSTFRLVLPAQS